MSGWPLAETTLARVIALAGVILLLTAGCGTAAERSGDTSIEDGGEIAVPRRGVFATSTDHFDRVVDSGELPTVVNVWASWCIPCRAETPRFVAAANRYEGRVRFVGLNTQDEKDAALEFIDEFEIPYPSGLDATGAIAKHLRILGLPATIFYDAGGDEVFAHNGEISADDLEEKINGLLRVSRSASGKGS